MKDQKIIDRLIRERVMELVTRPMKYPPLPEGFEKFIIGKG